MKVINCLIKNEKKLEELNLKRRFYNNFYEFNKETNLGKTYRETELKIKICERLTKVKRIN